MPKIYDAVEIGLTRAELRQALVRWLSHKTLFSAFTVTDVSLHPAAEYVVRFKVEPPLEKTQQEQIAAPAETPDLCKSPA